MQVRGPVASLPKKLSEVFCQALQSPDAPDAADLGFCPHHHHLQRGPSCTPAEATAAEPVACRAALFLQLRRSPASRFASVAAAAGFLPGLTPSSVRGAAGHGTRSSISVGCGAEIWRCLFVLLAEVSFLEAFFLVFFWKVCALTQVKETVFWELEASK